MNTQNQHHNHTMIKKFVLFDDEKLKYMVDFLWENNNMNVRDVVRMLGEIAFHFDVKSVEAALCIGQSMEAQSKASTETAPPLLEPINTPIPNQSPAT